MDINCQTPRVSLSSFSSSKSYSKDESKGSTKPTSPSQINGDIVYEALYNASEGWEDMLAAIKKNDLNFEDESFVFISTNGKIWKDLSRTSPAPDSVCAKMIKSYKTLIHDDGCRIIYGFERSSGIITKRVGININLGQTILLTKSNQFDRVIF